MAEGRICKICMEAKPGNEMRNTTKKCSHSYCTKCIARHIATKVQENITLITCPEFNCKERLEAHSCRDIISGAVLDRWEIASLCLVSESVLHRRGDEDKLLIQLAEKKKWRKCPYCKYYVERTMGCVELNFAMAVEKPGAILMKQSARE
ncbi:uncharacterized protein LOC113337053 [Papaver somniferum]|uniref:uncharacterized protein LOC113337049 n=1 Tax=Papaver somniferum TaxID=3469 RepID=UPI000E6FD49F|nr:uncharacterized protein LOC113337049 [Papaver somniferum]XP_026438529.1 uncharacterized protein LOC113337053 [Papaver somniferum]